MHSIALSLALLPLTDVTIAAISAFPHSMPFLQSLMPLPVIHLTVTPFIDAPAMGLAPFETPKVGVAVGITFKGARAISQILPPLSFILSTPLIITHHSDSMTNKLALLFNQLADINCLRLLSVIVPNLEARHLNQLLKDNFWGLYCQWRIHVSYDLVSFLSIC
jgi:hypothetical protein